MKGSMLAALAMSALGSIDYGRGPSNAEMEERKAREEARRARQTWDVDPTESRQVRRARERKAAKR